MVAPPPQSVDTGDTGTARLLAFSDGVFAIAITLLILSIGVPDIKSGQSLPDALLKEWPAYLSYLMSFVIIGIIWAQHHHLFSHIVRTDHIFLLINVFFLMWIAFVPFPTLLLAKYLSNGHQQQLAMSIYAGTFLVGTIPFNLLWGYAAWKERLLARDADPVAVAKISRSFLLGPIAYLTDFALSFVPGWGVWASLILFFIIAMFYALSPVR
jgi:uncharacterized membrane protein